VAPKVDASQVDDVKPKADEAAAALFTLDGTFTPKVDTSSIAAARAEVQGLKSDLESIGALAKKGYAGARPSLPPMRSIGSTSREHFGIDYVGRY
jgi:hypothetical protein